MNCHMNVKPICDLYVPNENSMYGAQVMFELNRWHRREKKKQDEFVALPLREG